MNFRNNVLFFSALLNASVLLGQPVNEKNEDPAKRFSGIFLGIHTGYQHFLVKNNYVNTLGHLFSPTGSSGVEYLTAHGSMIGGNVVVSHVFDNHVYIGAEIAGTYHFGKRTSIDEANFGRSFYYKQNDEYALSMRVGGIFGSVLCYSKAGFGIMRRTITTNFQYLSMYDELKHIETVMISKKKLKGFSVGLGCTIPLDETLSFGLETEYAKYETDKISHALVQDYVLNANNLKVKMAILIKI